MSERKLDEELGMTKRFVYDYEIVEETVKKFGQLVKVKTNHYETNGMLLTPSSSIYESSDNITRPQNLAATPAPLVIPTSSQLEQVAPKLTTPPEQVAPKLAATNSNYSMRSVNEEVDKNLVINYNNQQYTEAKKPRKCLICLF